MLYPKRLNCDRRLQAEAWRPLSSITWSGMSSIACLSRTKQYSAQLLCSQPLVPYTNSLPSPALILFTALVILLASDGQEILDSHSTPKRAHLPRHFANVDSTPSGMWLSTREDEVLSVLPSCPKSSYQRLQRYR